MLNDQQIAFFHTFGYLHLPGYFAEEISWITEEFERAWAMCPLAHDGSKRSIYPATFVGATERLASLIEHPKVAAVCRGALGDGYGFQGGDGNFYSGDTGWHSDAFGQWPEKTTARHLKIAWYLDPLTRDTGALRVIPGSHHEGDAYSRLLERRIPTWMPGHGELGMSERDIPCMAIESRPGDLVCFDHRVKHAAFGGGKRRRMFTTNWMEGAHTPAQRESLLNVYRFYRDHERADFSLDQGPWWSRPPPARAPLLALAKELGEVVVAEAREGAATR